MILYKVAKYTHMDGPWFKLYLMVDRKMWRYLSVKGLRQLMMVKLFFCGCRFGIYRHYEKQNKTRFFPLRPENQKVDKKIFTDFMKTIMPQNQRPVNKLICDYYISRGVMIVTCSRWKLDMSILLGCDIIPSFSPYSFMKSPISFVPTTVFFKIGGNLA